VQARYNDVRYPLTQATVMHIVDNYKMVYYLGYEELGSEPEKYLLFDIEADPEEMTELSQTKRETATELLNIIKTKLKESNDTYTQ
jgi:arylsulfatase A-like enzyme